MYIYQKKTVSFAEGRISGSSVFARLGNDGSPNSSGGESPLNLSTLAAKLEAANYESKYGSKVDKKGATPTQTKVTVTGLGKLVVSSSSAEVIASTILTDVSLSQCNNTISRIKVTRMN